MRKFELVSNAKEGCKLPKRSTLDSAGYDFVCPETVAILPQEMVMIKSGVKACMNRGEHLELFVRSSVGVNRHLMLANCTGIIDKDYYNNEDNEGEIGIPLYNYGKETVVIKAGERVAQGIFMAHFITDEDRKNYIYNVIEEKERSGGFGSTGK